jgi:drug/metabolite transporter (DMT)-like permease
VPVGIALLLAAASAVCYGVGTVLQAIGARRTTAAEGLDVRLLARLARQAPFLAGTALDLLGAVAQFAALRGLAVFVVQATQAANLAVTAVVAVPVLGMRLAGRDWTAVGAVCAGLALIALSAGPESPRNAPLSFHLGLLATALVLTATAPVAARIRTPALRSVGLGMVAGLAFGVVALAVRCITDLHPAHLLADPAAWALAVGGVLAYLCYATGIQHSEVTTVVAAIVIAETAVPAVIGVVALGDGTRPGTVPLAVTGFLMAVAGAVGLAATEAKMG